MERRDGALTDALDVLCDEIRMGIVRELADADRPLPFTELRDRVGVSDSGKFNYHLGKLCSYFVRDTQDGYELRDAGTRVLTATEAAVTGGAESAVAGTCPVCGDDDCEKVFHVHLGGPLE